MKKHTVFTLCASLSFVILLAGCGQGIELGGNNDGGSSNSENDPPPPLHPTLGYASYWGTSGNSSIEALALTVSPTLPLSGQTVLGSTQIQQIFNPQNGTPVIFGIGGSPNMNKYLGATFCFDVSSYTSSQLAAYSQLQVNGSIASGFSTAVATTPASGTGFQIAIWNGDTGLYLTPAFTTSDYSSDGIGFNTQAGFNIEDAVVSVTPTGGVTATKCIFVSVMSNDYVQSPTPQSAVNFSVTWLGLQIQ